jgi:restriction endonuclease S subunit
VTDAPPGFTSSDLAAVVSDHAQLSAVDGLDDGPIPQIPDTWRWVRLHEIAEVVGGVTKDSKKQSDPAYIEVPYLRVANVQRGQLNLSDVSTIRVAGSKAKELMLRHGDVLLNEGGDRDKLGRGWVWEDQIPNCIHQNHVFRARIIEDAIHPKLLAWHANEFGKSWCERNGKQSTNLASISLSKIRMLPVPIPPPEEQKRIVRALEGQMAMLNTSRRTVARAEDRLSRLWIKTVEKIISSSSSGKSATTLGDIATTFRNGIFVSRAGTEPNGVPILRIGAVRSMKLDVSDVRYTGMTVDQLLASKNLLAPGDLLFTRYNGNPNYVGVCAVVPDRVDALTHPDKLIRVTVDSSAAVPEYVALSCSFGPIREKIRSLLKTTAGQVGISGRELKTLRIDLPTLEEQILAVARYGELRVRVESLRSALDQISQSCNELQRSVIIAALTGNLPLRRIDDEATPHPLKAQNPKLKKRKISKVLSSTNMKDSASLECQQ